MMKKITLTIYLLLSLPVFAQEEVEILKKVNEKLSHYTDYQLSMTYSLYKTSFSTDIIEQYFGKFVKSGENTYSRVKNTEFIRTKNTSLTISNDERAIFIGDNETDLTTQFDIEKLTKNAEKIEVRTYNTEYGIEVTPSGIVGNTFALIILRIDKKTYFVNGITYFFLQSVDFSNDFQKADYGQPRLEIALYDLTKKIQLNEATFELSLYYKKNNGSLVGVNEYAKYQIIRPSSN